MGSTSVESSLKDLVSDLQAKIPISDRTYRSSVLGSCFIASEAVDYLVENGHASTRRKAVELGRALQTEHRFFENVDDNFLFDDGLLFFRFLNDGKRNALTKLDSISATFKRQIQTFDYKHRMTTQKRCFVGSEAVDLLIAEGFANARSAAVELARSLHEDVNLFCPLQKDEKFVDDDDAIYRLPKDSEKWKQPLDWTNLGDISKGVIKIGTRGITGVTNGVIVVGKKATSILGTGQETEEEETEESTYTSVESLLTRELEIRFIDARKLVNQSKVNLDVQGYPSKLQERLILIEAINLFHERDAHERISLQSLKDGLDNYKNSMHSNASCTSTSMASDFESDAEEQAISGSNRSFLGRIRRRMSGDSRGSTSSRTGRIPPQVRTSKSRRRMLRRGSNVSGSSSVLTDDEFEYDLESD